MQIVVGIYSSAYVYTPVHRHFDTVEREREREGGGTQREGGREGGGRGQRERGRENARVVCVFVCVLELIIIYLCDQVNDNSNNYDVKCLCPGKICTKDFGVLGLMRAFC